MIIFPLRELFLWLVIRDGITFPLLDYALIEPLTWVFSLLFYFTACLVNRLHSLFIFIHCFVVVAIPSIFNVVKDVPATLLETFLDKVPLILPLTASHLETVLNVELPLILFLLLPLKLTLELFNVHRLYIFIAIPQLSVFTFVIADRIIVTTGVVDEIYGLFKVPGPLKDLNLGPLIERFLIERQRIDVHKNSTVTACRFLCSVIVKVTWKRLRFCLIKTYFVAPVFLILPIDLCDR